MEHEDAIRILGETIFCTPLGQAAVMAIAAGGRSICKSVREENAGGICREKI